MAKFTHVTPPAQGQTISVSGGKLAVPDQPIIPFIEGDGTGPDIWRASQRVFDAAVQKAYGGKKRIAWMEVYAGEKSFKKLDSWLPDDTVEAFKTYLVGIKGPLTTPIGGGIRSLNVELRQKLDLYVCLRPVRYFKGVPSPVKHPEKVEMVIFRENTEDIYAGIEYAGGTPESQKILDFLSQNFPKEFAKIRFGTKEAAAQWLKQLENVGSASRGGSGCRHRLQAGELPRHHTSCSRRHQLRHRAPPQERDVRAQGEYHEVHRGRVSRLGL